MAVQALALVNQESESLERRRTMTWIKICGITNLEDALVAVEAGADALGFVFYEKSPRRVEPHEVRRMSEQLPHAIEKIGVFVGTDSQTILTLAEKARLSGVQLQADRGNSPTPQPDDLIFVRSRAGRCPCAPPRVGTGFAVFCSIRERPRNLAGPAQPSTGKVRTRPRSLIVSGLRAGT